MPHDHGWTVRLVWDLESGQAMSVFSVGLRFSRHLDTVNTWRINSTSDGIDARIRVASGPDVTVEGIKMRFRAGKSPGVVFVRQIQEDIFHTESALLDDRLPRVELLLGSCPGEAAELLRGL